MYRKMAIWNVKAWMVGTATLRENGELGKPSLSDNPFNHDSYEKALAEAQRLFRIEPQKAFVVFATTVKHCGEQVHTDIKQFRENNTLESDKEVSVLKDYIWACKFDLFRYVKNFDPSSMISDKDFGTAKITDRNNTYVIGVSALIPETQKTSKEGKTFESREASIKDTLILGAKLGLGKAAQNTALQTLKATIPETSMFLDNPYLVTIAKMILPILGKYLSGYISNEGISEKIEMVSQAMLLVNSIDLGAKVTSEMIQYAQSLLGFAFSIFGLSEAESHSAQAKLIEDSGFFGFEGFSFEKSAEEVNASIT